MSWVLGNPIAITAGFLLSAGLLWIGTFFSEMARGASREQNRNERLIEFTSYCAAVSLVAGSFGCLFFAIRFVRWAWYF